MMSWEQINDDTQRAEFGGVTMEVNFMRTHWAWLISSKTGLPLAGSFIHGEFPETFEEARALCYKYANKYVANPIKYMDDLDDKLNDKFEVKLNINGMQAILISMILFENSREGIFLTDTEITEEDTIYKVQEISKSILAQWKGFSENFELMRK